VKMVKKKNREYSEHFRTENDKEKEYRMPWAVHHCCFKVITLSYTQVSFPVSWGFVMKAGKPTISDYVTSGRHSVNEEAHTWPHRALFLLDCVDRNCLDVIWVRFTMLPFASQGNVLHTVTNFQFLLFSPSRIYYHWTSLKEKRKRANEGISRLDKSFILAGVSKKPASALPPVYVPSSCKRI
jgi:hypothetical protein